MKREDFERLKEEEKKHLREIGDLKQKLREAQRMQRIGRALHDIEHAGDLEGFDLSLEEVQRKAAEQEARLDLAVESSGAIDPVEIPPLDDEALQKARAAEFIQRMKLSIEDAGSKAEIDRSGNTGRDAEQTPPEKKEDTPSDFEKTIGRMNPRAKDK